MESSLIIGSQEWKSWRKNKITSTDCSIILKSNPFKTRNNLWKQKLGLLAEDAVNFKMSEGSRLEKEALSFFNQQMGLNLKPCAFQNPFREWQGTSLDGYDGKYAVEIKCSEKTYKMALNNEISEYYTCQMQHHISTCELDHMYYYAYWDRKGKSIEVKRDQDFIDHMIIEEKKFWDCMQNLELPDPEEDIIEMDSNEWIENAMKLKCVRDSIKHLQDMEEGFKKKLIELSEGKNARGYGLQVSTCVRKGVVDYSSIAELDEVDLEKYRKPPTTYVKISEVK